MTIWFSLHRRLLWMLLGGVSACWLATLAWSYVDAHREIDALFDAQLAQTAQALLAQSRRHDRHESHDDIEELERAAHRYQRMPMFQIWHDDGALVLRSPNAPTTPLASVDGFSEVRGANGHWRYFSQWDQHHRHRVQVAENHAVRDDLVGNIAWRLLLPALVGLPLLGAWVWFATRRGLAPLDAVAAQIGSRAPERLHAVAPEAAPEEIRPLLDALNDLFRRVGAAIEGERRFTADAAHELRTPLAAIAAQARVAARARDDAERGHAMEQLATGTARAAHLVDQLLTLARLDPQQSGDIHAADVRLDQLAAEVCAAHGNQALEKNIALALEATPVVVMGNADLLRVLLRNLVDNAIRYTPAHGSVTVGVTNNAAGACIEVVDNGAGIPETERERVLERFSRLAGQDTEGSGLGLSIARRIAELHGARLTLGEGAGGRGLAVGVVFAPGFRCGAAACPPGTS